MLAAAAACRGEAVEAAIVRRPGRVLLVVAALMLGIGSCQLPQPHLPKLLVGAAAGGGPTTTVLRVPVHARSGPG
jgi:hypothetical protein